MVTDAAMGYRRHSILTVGFISAHGARCFLLENMPMSTPGFINKVIPGLVDESRCLLLQLYRIFILREDIAYPHSQLVYQDCGLVNIAAYQLGHIHMKTLNDACICQTFDIAFSNRWYTSFQSPSILLSIATWVIPFCNSHSFNSVKELVKVSNERVFLRIPSPLIVATTYKWTSMSQPSYT